MYEAVLQLEHASSLKDWKTEHWKLFLRSSQENHSSEVNKIVAGCLTKCPTSIFKDLSHDISFWIQFSSAHLLENDSLWELWDRLANTLPGKFEFQEDVDLYFQSLNNSFSNLAYSLISALDNYVRTNHSSIPNGFTERLQN